MENIKRIWGMPTLIELDGIEQNVKLCTALKLGFVELNMNLPEYQVDRIDVDKLKYLKEQHNIFFTIHLPEEFNIANFNTLVNQAYTKTFQDTVIIACEIGCPILNMHMNEGVYFTLPDKKVYLYEKYQKEYIEKIKDFKSEIFHSLKDKNIRLAIENTGIYNSEYIKVAVEELLTCNKVGLTWDIGHDYSSGNKDYDFIMEHEDRLVHMHFHDGMGKNNHLPLFAGEIDIQSRFHMARKHQCLCVLETKTVDGLILSVEKLRKLR